jgi:hypothetical protein
MDVKQESFENLSANQSRSEEVPIKESTRNKKSVSFKKEDSYKNLSIKKSLIKEPTDIKEEPTDVNEPPSNQDNFFSKLFGFKNASQQIVSNKSQEIQTPQINESNKLISIQNDINTPEIKTIGSNETNQIGINKPKTSENSFKSFFNQGGSNKRSRKYK